MYSCITKIYDRKTVGHVFSFNVKHSIPLCIILLLQKYLTDDLLDIPYIQTIKLASFDIENMYPNIPTDELLPIIEHMSINNQLDDNTTHNLMRITSTVLEQNYFTFSNNY
jgi:hypothetical protein